MGQATGAEILADGLGPASPHGVADAAAADRHLDSPAACQAHQLAAFPDMIAGLAFLWPAAPQSLAYNYLQLGALSKLRLAFELLLLSTAKSGLLLCQWHAPPLQMLQLLLLLHCAAWVVRYVPILPIGVLLLVNRGLAPWRQLAACHTQPTIQ